MQLSVVEFKVSLRTSLYRTSWIEMTSTYFLPHVLPHASSGMKWVNNIFSSYIFLNLNRRILAIIFGHIIS